MKKINKMIDITINDEIGDTVFISTGQLNLESGEISNITKSSPQYKGEQPWKDKDYLYTYGAINMEGKELEFAIEVKKDQYHVSENERRQMLTHLPELFFGEPEAPAPSRRVRM